jgi:hypothetical protein
MNKCLHNGDVANVLPKTGEDNAVTGDLRFTLPLLGAVNAAVTLTTSRDQTINANPAGGSASGQDHDREQRIKSTHAGRSRHHVREEQQKTSQAGQWREESDREGDANRELSHRDQDGNPSGVGDNKTVEKTPPPAESLNRPREWFAKRPTVTWIDAAWVS